MNPNLSRSMNQALRAFRSGKSEEAEAILQRVIHTSPKEVGAWMALASIAVETGQPIRAIERYRQVLALDPRNGQATFYLGVLLSHRGDYSDAISYLEASLSAEPGILAALIALANCYFNVRRMNDALQTLSRAININPGDPQLRLSRASCYYDLSRFGEAETDLTLATRKLSDPKALILLARVQLALNRDEDAIKSAELSITMDASDPAPYLVVATASLSLRLEDVAEIAWKQAEALSSKPTQVFKERTRALMALGRFDEAEELLIKWREQEPEAGEPYYSTASIKKITRSDTPFVHQAESNLSHHDLSDQDRLFLLHALGKAYDDLGQFEEAIRYFDQANVVQRRLDRRGATFEKGEFETYIDVQISEYSAASIRANQKTGNLSSTPIFVVGMMRSGTTLLEQILTRHPCIGGVGEQPFWVDHEQELRLSKFEPDGEGGLNRLTSEYLRILSSCSNRPRVIDKNPANVMISGLLASVFPNGKIIHVKRHPVDTALSIWMTLMQTSAPFINDRSNIVYAYQQYRRAADHWRDAIPETQLIEIEYEQLVHRPEETIRRILEFCGLEWDPVCLDPHANPKAVRTPSFWQARQPFFLGSVQKWKKYEPWLAEFADLMPK